MRKDFDWDNASLSEFHIIISEEAYRLTRLVENLLEMARIEAGELHPANILIEKGGKIAAIAAGCDPSGLLAKRLSEKAANIVGAGPAKVEEK